MNRRLVWLIALLPLLAGLGQMQPVQAQADAKAAQKEIQALYDRWVGCWKRKDIAAIMAPFAPDFVYTYANGQVRNRKQIEADWTGALKTMKLESVSISAGKVTLKGNEATDVATWKSTCLFTDPQGKSHPGAQLFVARDTLVKTSRGWMFKRSQDLKVVTTVGGKQVADPYDPFGTAKKPKK